MDRELWQEPNKCASAIAAHFCNRYCFKFLRLCRKLEVPDSQTSCFGPCQSSRSAALPKGSQLWGREWRHTDTNVQRFLTKFFRGVFGRSTSSTVLCISVFCHVVFFQLCCVALCCDLLCVVFLSFPCCVALCCVAICCVYCSCLLPVVLRCVVLRFATVFA